MGRGGGTGQMPALASEPPAARRVRASWPAAACLPASVPFCHSGFVLLSHSISVTSCPPLICHGKDFKYRLALGDSDTYQWIQVSTHDQSSLKLSHLPNDSAVSSPNHVISARTAHARMSPELLTRRACHGVGYSLLM